MQNLVNLIEDLGHHSQGVCLIFENVKLKLAAHTSNMQSKLDKSNAQSEILQQKMELCSLERSRTTSFKRVCRHTHRIKATRLDTPCSGAELHDVKKALDFTTDES